MDKVVIQWYRKLLEVGFEHSGTFENPSIFVEAIGEQILSCGNSGNFMQLYIDVVDNTINDIKYTCICNPTANVAIEVLCTLTKGKTVDEVSSMTEEAFYRLVGSEGEELQAKVKGVLELLNKGIVQFREQTPLSNERS